MNTFEYERNFIDDWIREDPETNLKKLCKKFEEDDSFVYEFVSYHPELQDFLKQFITSSKYAYKWACYVEDVELMKEKITHPEYAYKWAMVIKDHHELMRRIVKNANDSFWIQTWNTEFLNHPIPDIT